MSYTVRQYNDSDLQKVLSLYSDVFGSGMTVDIFHWKYIQSITGQGPRAVVAENDQEIIGFVGNLPVPLQMDTISIRSIQPVDIMVREEYRGVKIFNQLVTTLRELFNNEGVCVEFGRPTEETRKVWERFQGWQFSRISRDVRIHRPEVIISNIDNISDLVLFFAKMLGIPFRLILKSIDTVASLGEVNYDVKKSPEYIHSLFEILPPAQYPIHIKRDSKFWKWRVNDPRVNVYSYWIGERTSPTASILVGDYKTHNTSEVLLQSGYDNQDFLPALLTLYRQFIRDFRSSARLRVPSSFANELARPTQLTHNKYISYIGDRLGIGAMKDYGSQVYGWRWFEESVPEQIKKAPISEWEYSALISD